MAEILADVVVRVDEDVSGLQFLTREQSLVHVLGEDSGGGGQAALGRVIGTPDHTYCPRQRKKKKEFIFYFVDFNFCFIQKAFLHHSQMNL